MIASAASALLATALLATPPVPRAEYPLGAKTSERMMADFSRCVIGDRRLRAWAEYYLRLIPETPAFRDAALRIATPDCMPHSFTTLKLRFQGKLFRETLYTALYQRDFGRSPPPSDLKALPPFVLAAEFDGDAAAIPATVTFERIVGDCVARADPAGVHRLLMTKIASGEEQAALQQVVPELAGCVPAGQRAAFSRTVFRGLLAEALYKLRRAAAAPATNLAAEGHAQ